jgi:phthiocerol/phenolphthiocerol synthesis type-I polyketide synthase E
LIKEVERSHKNKLHSVNQYLEINRIIYMGNVHLTGYEIAVIGMAGRFPGADNLKEYWNNLKEGIESVSYLDSEELKSIDSSLKDQPNFVNSNGGELTSSSFFDEEFFGYTPSESEIMDPQMRILHECAWEALEDAGYNSQKYKGDIGLFAGASSNFHWEAASYLSDRSKMVGFFSSALLTNKDYLGTRISYKLNLKGQSITIFTACSTSLVAIHMAARSLLTGENDMALAGGASISTRKKEGYLYQEGMIYSSDGHCRPFDENASGTVQGDGVGFVLLKPYDKAIEDKDNIYAVIKGSAVNNDGCDKVGYSAPGINGQINVIKTALHMSEVDTESITYIEAHGTGTKLGDPAEIKALTSAFNTQKRNYCAIGSVKSNIGHLDVAAGVAGFIKAVLAIKNRMIPPSINYSRPNPAINFEQSPFYVNSKLQEWNSSNFPIRAGVSSFGIGGTNAHVVLEESSVVYEKRNTKNNKLLIFSAASQSQLIQHIENTISHIKANQDLNIDDVA